MSTIGVSLDLFLRWPLLKTDKSPWGTLNPYLVAGVPLFKTTVTPRTTAQFRNQDSDTDVSVGYKVGGGLAYQIAPNLMVFAEYRFMHSEASVELRVPTGDEEALRGLGVTRVLYSGIWSRSGKISPHVNVGFEQWSDSVSLRADGAADFLGESACTRRLRVTVKARRSTLASPTANAPPLDGAARRKRAFTRASSSRSPNGLVT